MKKVMVAVFSIMLLLSGGLVAAILSASPASADILDWNVNDPITYVLTNTVTVPGFGSGGLFTITNVNTGAVIESFCIELDEHIYNGDLVAGISDAAMLGGRFTDSGDPISSATNWLYAQYFLGNAKYNNPAALQIAFWLLEEEISKAEAISWFNEELRTTAFRYVEDALSYTGDYGTMVLNLKDASTGAPHQSQLIHTDPIPEPATMLLFGSGFVGLLVRFRNKFRKN